MAYQTKLIDFSTPEERTVQFDQWLQEENKDRDISIKDAVLSSDQALIIYEDKTPETK